MSEITYTLLGDGSSDKALVPIINWTLERHFPDLIIQSQWADFSQLRNPPPINQLSKRIAVALQLFPCNWLFVHRDAEKQTVEMRQQEIDDAWREQKKTASQYQIVSVIPVRMTEAWLLIDEQAIRVAAANPSGKQRIQLPSVRLLESLSDPKNKLKQLLREASGLQGRRLQQFNESKAIQLVAQNIQDFSALKNLSAYAQFEEMVKRLPSPFL
ncbi:DUF4276 family protein [Rudanella paleaurantiibacter]|uniref:DUF4276 family protein n=1 Tax=Rudanella paleaurantiibacter TaxID=2614655 RepID=A0A7J5TX04_9BACT|nr:DUF4276 family protein [Rudanella paleaurantiibacter]KAB7729107.1 DUF4276 family protein [Rudanella paleaurantiibacter]